MSEFWYYAEDNETRGPITFDQLIKILSLMPSPRGVLVWREGFDNWEAAESISEIVEKLIRPPPLPTRSSVIARTETTLKDAAAKDLEGLDTVARYQQQFGNVKPELPSDQNANTRGRIAFLVVFMFVLLVGAYFTNQIYSNSIDGIAYLIGQLAAPWIILTALTWKVRRSAYTAAVVLAVAALSVGIANTGKLQEIIAAHEGKAALQGVTDPKQIDEALRKHPSNTFLQMIATANKAAIETNAATEKLSDEVEPPALSKDIDLGTASRSDLEALRRDLKTAEANATTFMPRYSALLKAERDKVENYALSLNVDKNTVSSLLDGVDKRHARTTAFTSKILLARTEFYRAYENYVAVLVGEFGAYKVTNGQFTFPLQRTADRYNVAVSTMTAAAKRVADLDVERKALMQSQQEGWERFVKGK